MLDLDLSYGELVHPSCIDEYEKSENPVSVETLNSTNAANLKLYMASAISGLKLSELIAQQLPILWVIDEDGELQFAIEEYLNAENPALRIGRFGKLPRVINTESGEWSRIGHPSLLPSKLGRIGGELVLKDGDWVLSNRSGRYGVVFGRKEAQLESVKRLLHSFGLTVIVDWVPAAQREMRS